MSDRYGFLPYVLKFMDFRDDFYCFSVYTWQIFHIIYSHISVPYHGTLIM